ncbi:MAG: UPF0280 family protein [Rhodobacteraceae bacterium]|nr:UPF0280 family protein [Paracoccaceae bacterium]
MSALAAMLPDGRRLHLNHGPIDLIVEADAGHRAAAYAAAAHRFATVLDELVAELPVLRQPVTPGALTGPVARRMEAACLPHRPVFITPMAAVAGAVADEIVAAMATVSGLAKAYVNNGGDIALHLTGGESFTALMPGGRVTLAASDPARGIATSGWRGRSHSLGIADAVTVIAANAAAADAAATLIANAVDLPGHLAIARRPACELQPDSDLGDRLVTIGVGPLTAQETADALASGFATAQAMLARGLIGAAHLTLNGQTRALTPEPAHA